MEKIFITTNSSFEKIEKISLNSTLQTPLSTLYALKKIGFNYKIQLLSEAKKVSFIPRS